MEYEVLGQLSITSLHSGSWLYPSISSSKDQVPAPGHCRDCRITMQAEPGSLLGALHLALLANVTFVWFHFCLSYQVTVYGKEPALSYWCRFPSYCFSAGLTWWLLKTVNLTQPRVAWKEGASERLSQPGSLLHTCGELAWPCWLWATAFSRHEILNWTGVEEEPTGWLS